MKFIFWSLCFACLLGGFGCGSRSPSPSSPNQQPTGPSDPSFLTLSNQAKTPTSSKSVSEFTSSSTLTPQCTSKTLKAYQTHKTNLQTQLSKFKGFLHYLKGLPEGIGIRMQRAQMMIQFNRDFLNRLRAMETIADQCTDLQIRYIKYRTRLADDLGQLVDSLS